MTRENIMTALLAKLSGAYAFSVATRRNRDPNTLIASGQTALILLKHHEHYTAKSPSAPSIRTLHLLAVVYVDVTDDHRATPDTLLSAIADAIDAALVPDSPDNRCTLGGKCWSAKIDGEVTNAPGDMTGKGLALIPISVVMP